MKTIVNPEWTNALYELDFIDIKGKSLDPSPYIRTNDSTLLTKGFDAIDWQKVIPQYIEVP